ncbi:MAG: PH domain-containing protein [Rhodospirillales bacterium]|nr:PH domain-containing protein [Rhodospirillales bacterium]MCB9995482.1 PH domain-containing protein [Rhodospirillales bacterium]
MIKAGTNMKAPARDRKQPDPAIQSLIKPDEKVIRVATIHPGIYWKTVCVAILAFLLILTPVRNLGFFLAFVALVMYVLASMYKKFLVLVLTDKRVFLRHGILRVDTIQIRHSRIESVETERTITGQLLGYAAVVIYGTGSRRTAIPFIADALEFRNELDEMLAEYEEGAASKPTEE